MNKPVLKIKNYGGLKKSLNMYNLNVNKLIDYSLVYLMNSNNSFICFNVEQLIFNFSK